MSQLVCFFFFFFLHLLDRLAASTYSCVHWLRTRRRVMEDLPQPPSPQTVIDIRCASSIVGTRVVVGGGGGCFERDLGRRESHAGEKELGERCKRWESQRRVIMDKDGDGEG